ncbi:MAG: SIMPL domain-containing protein [bacterium]|jgi:hypothetical protein
MSSDKFPQHFWGLVVLSAALVVFAVIASAAAVKIKRANDLITVTGSAKRQITSDYITWGGSVSFQALTQQAAYAEVEKYSARVRQFFKDKGVPDEWITFNPLQSERYVITDKHADGSETRHWEYSITQTFEVKGEDVAAIEALPGEIAVLLNEGIPLESWAPQYLYTKLADIRGELLAEATKDAKSRAKAIAESAGGRVGSVRQARMGVFQITPRFSTEVSDYGMYDTSSLQKDVTAVVSITFAVE